MFKKMAPEGWKAGSWRSSMHPEPPVDNVESTYIEDRRLY